MDPRRPKRLTAILREVWLRGSRASSSPGRSLPLGSDPPYVRHACQHDRKRVREAAVGVARLGLSYGWNDPREVQPRQSRENGSARLLRPRHG
ncbi:hypothetical protein CRG98_040808, partial [Punica granatum]